MSSIVFPFACAAVAGIVAGGIDWFEDALYGFRGHGRRSAITGFVAFLLTLTLYVIIAIIAPV